MWNYVGKFNLNAGLKRVGVAIAFLVLTGILKPQGAEGATKVYVLDLKDVVITQVTVDVIREALERANSEHAQCLIIQLSTNGGMVEATQDIIEELLNAPLPVVVYVAPRGARAFSAGTFVLIAGHVAAMAPATSTGAAHPVTIPLTPPPSSEEEAKRQKDAESIMLDKLTNALMSTAKAVAEERKRKFEWAERVIRNSEALTANEALKMGLIDMIAEDLGDLLSKLDGRKVKVGRGEVKLRTKDARVVYIQRTTRQKFLEILSHPNIAYILLLVATFCFLIEIYNPGAIIPAVIGSIAFLLFLYSSTLLPVNWVGVLLILLSIAFFVAELFVVSHGVLTAGGLISLALGGYMLIDMRNPQFWGIALRVSVPVIMATVTMFGGFITLVIWKAISAHMRRVVVGAEGMVGRIAIAQTALTPRGTVLMDGSFWNAESVNGHVRAGERVEVVAVDGLLLKVRRVNATNSSSLSSNT
ncbi:MAG: nodulation protein NfeD [Armatimonadota bacterium]|nr:nodulation protein NfeD [Armatimonadota bacterium]MCX7777473.1 nodulation protein NfeD [Armatimonadota bacterium]MDW8025518.1 nodulation protein NfeD [Armatimonadota bacterium]